MLTMQEIKELIQMIDQSSIQYFEMKRESSKIIIQKNSLPADQQAAVIAADCVEEKITDLLPGSKAENKERAIAVQTENIQQETHLYQIVSPMAGTFYAAPEPGAEPFVKVGQKIDDTTVVCIVESMKVFTEVEAEITGEIVEILVENEAPVGYGQPLFTVKLA